MAGLVLGSFVILIILCVAILERQDYKHRGAYLGPKTFGAKPTPNQEMTPTPSKNMFSIQTHDVILDKIETTSEGCMTYKFSGEDSPCTGKKQELTLNVEPGYVGVLPTGIGSKWRVYLQLYNAEWISSEP